MKKITKIIAGLGIVFYLIIALSTDSNNNSYQSSNSKDNSSSQTKEETKPETNGQQKQTTNQSATSEQTTTTNQDSVAAKKNSYIKFYLDAGKIYTVPSGKVWILQGYRATDDCSPNIECMAIMLINNKSYRVLRCSDMKDAGLIAPLWTWDEIKLKPGTTVQTGNWVKTICVHEYNE